MKTVTARAIETNFPSFLQEVENGEEVLITKDNRPIARLLPATDTIDRKKFRQAVERLKEFRRTNLLSLRGLDWRKLRDEGKKE